MRKFLQWLGLVRPRRFRYWRPARTKLRRMLPPARSLWWATMLIGQRVRHDEPVIFAEPCPSPHYCQYVRAS